MSEVETQLLQSDSVEKPVGICEEYQYLVEKSHQLFSGLRDLQQIGKKHWQPFFQRCFDVYTKLWKFQQQHRQILEDKKRFGLQRWEIGEIASKIGQLYYHYYLRTSETKYVHEAYVFYDAIRVRGYFRNIVEGKRPELAIRKLRYYVRFIVVCLLLNRKSVVVELVDELKALIEQYSQVFRPSDTREWQLVLQELSSFILADSPLIVTETADGTPPVSYRQHIDRTVEMTFPQAENSLGLADIVLVSNQKNQVKFSEITLDMFRVIQSLEYDFDDSKKDKAAQNPHKYLLYCPTISTLLSYLACASEELPDNGALLLYFIADGTVSTEKTSGEVLGFEMNPGIIRSRPESEGNCEGPDLTNFLRCEDIVPFCRKPMVLIADSNHSFVFKRIVDLHCFDQPLLVLLSPEVVPFGLRDPGQAGNILSLFLYSPLIGLMSVLGVSRTTQSVFDQCNTLLCQYFSAVAGLLDEKRNEIEKPFHVFLQDFFLRSIILRFIFCTTVLKKHRSSYGNARYFPTSYPALPNTIIFDPGSIELIIELSNVLGVSPDSNPLINVPLETNDVAKTGIDVNV